MPDPVPPVIDPIPPPAPSIPTKPPLTPAMVAVDKESGAAPPGAGGWTPKQFQVVAVSAAAAGAMAALELLGIPTETAITAKMIAIAFGKGAVAYLVAYLGIKSAGHRKVTA